MAESSQKYLVITCDGGGIRGVMTAALLQDLGSSVLEKTNLYAGTSTGSILAVGLASDVSIEQLLAVYTSPSSCETFFTPYSPLDSEREVSDQLRSALTDSASGVDDQRVSGILSFLGDHAEALLFPIYSNSGRVTGITDAFGDKSTWTIGKIWSETGKRLVVPTFLLNQPLVGTEQEQWLAQQIHNLPGYTGSDDYQNLSTVEAAMCSSSAPVYFESFAPRDTGDLLFADGGLFANNPATLALAALAQSDILPPQGLDLDNVRLLSLGTGFNAASYPSREGFTSEFPWGLLGWLWPKATSTTPAFPLLESLFDGNSQIDSLQARSLLGADHFRRGNVPLQGNSISLNDCSQIDFMLELTAQYIETDEWQEIKSWVGENWG